MKRTLLYIAAVAIVATTVFTACEPDNSQVREPIKCQRGTLCISPAT